MDRSIDLRQRRCGAPNPPLQRADPGIPTSACTNGGRWRLEAAPASSVRRQPSHLALASPISLSRVDQFPTRMGEESSAELASGASGERIQSASVPEGSTERMRYMAPLFSRLQLTSSPSSCLPPSCLSF
jgi:hypothetical protein